MTTNGRVAKAKKPQSRGKVAKGATTSDEAAAGAAADTGAGAGAPKTAEPKGSHKVKFKLKVLEKRAMRAQQRLAMLGKGVRQNPDGESHPPFYRQVNEEIAAAGGTPDNEVFQMTRSARAGTTALVLEELRTLISQIAILCRRTNRRTVSLKELTTATYLLEPLGFDTTALRNSIIGAQA